MFQPAQQQKKKPAFLEDDEEDEDTFVPMQKPKGASNLFNDSQMSIKSQQ